MESSSVFHIRSVDSVYYNLRGDGTASLSYSFPEDMDLARPHAIKIIYINGPKKPVFINSNFIELQGLNSTLMMLLGTSLPNSNVYVPIRSNYISRVGWMIIHNMDGSPITQLDPINIGLHIVPVISLPTWRQ